MITLWKTEIKGKRLDLELLQNTRDSWRNKEECNLAHHRLQPARFLKPKLIGINDINFRTAQSTPNKTNSSQREDSKGINAVLGQSLEDSESFPARVFGFVFEFCAFSICQDSQYCTLALLGLKIHFNEPNM